MRRGRHPNEPGLAGPVVCCMLAIVALSLGPTGEAVLRATVRDAAVPGYLIERRFSHWLTKLDLTRWPWTEETVTRTAVTTDAAAARERDELTEARRQARALRAALAIARRDAAAMAASLGPIRPEAGASIPRVERIPARLLRTERPGVAAGGLLIGNGASDGLVPNLVTVESVTLAAGSDNGVPEGGVILAGAAIVGRTEDVGVWASTILSITDPEFRAHVAIVRDTEAGPVFGDEGILEGDGRGGCVIRYLPSTASVSVGDHVYSVDPTGRLPQPLYYGRIEQAELRRGAPHWDVTVRPAADPKSLTSVHVLVPNNSESPRTVTMSD